MKVSGPEFTLSGKPFYITGVNNHYLPWGSKAEVTRVFDDTVALGGTVMRTFLNPVIGSLDGQMPTVWDWKNNNDSDQLGVKGVYLLAWDPVGNKMVINNGPNGIQNFDFVIAEAKKRNIRLIIDFLDFAAFTGGSQQMLAWYHFSDKNMWYLSPQLKADYKTWVSFVLEHVNSLTGLRYKNDPTIMAWELVNEAQTDTPQLRTAWEAEMAAYVRAHDHNHLIGTGAANDKVTDLAKDLAIPNINFGAWHGYPKYFGISPQQFDDLIPQFCYLAPVFNKPVLLTEFGYGRSNPDQVQYYAKWLDTVQRDHDCAGWLVWRIVSLQDTGQFPWDEFDQFDVRTDETALWDVMKAAMRPAPHGVTSPGSRVP